MLISQPGPQSITTAMTKYERITYFLLVGVAFSFFCMLISAVLGINAAETLPIAGIALWIGWSLNDKMRRLEVSKTSYLALCVVYLISATTLGAILMPVVSNAKNETRGYYFILLIVIAYIFSWTAIKTIKQKPTAGASASPGEKKVPGCFV